MKRYDVGVKTGVGTRLREARLSKKLSQKDVSDELGMEKSRISEYENEHRAIDIWTLSSFCDLYGVTLDYLWYGTGPRYKQTRPQKPEISILEAIECLYYYKILDKKSNSLIFDSHDDGLLINFINDYSNIILNSNKINKEQNAAIKYLEKSYSESLKNSIFPNLKDKNIKEALDELNKHNHYIYQLTLL